MAEAGAVRRGAWRSTVVAVAVASLGVLVPAVVHDGGAVASAASPPASFDVGAALVPLAPARLLDTRTGDGAAAPGPVASEGDLVLQVTGRGGVPDDAVAVALTVTATEAAGAGYVTVWPAGQARPTASTLNVERPGQTIANGAIVPVGDGGRVVLHAQTATQLVVDVTGYWRSVASATAGRYRPVAPARVLDTRTGLGVAAAGAVPGGGVVQLGLAGVAGIPARGASAVAVTLTATGTTGPGYVTVWPGGDRPTTSVLNVDRAGEDVAATVVVPLSATGSTSIYVQTSSHLVADVTGWFTGAAEPTGRAGLLVPTPPTRLLDTRLDGTGGFVPGASRTLLLTEDGTSPSADVLAVVANLTATEATGPGYVAAAPAAPGAQQTSSLNVSHAGQTVANLVLGPVSAAGELTLVDQAGGHLVLDLAGYFIGDEAGGSTGGTDTTTTTAPGAGGPTTTRPGGPTTTRPPATTTPTTAPPASGDVTLSPWQVRANAPVIRTEGGAATVDGKIYVMGGYITGNTPTRRVDVYDAASDTWAPAPQLPEGVSHLGVAVIGTDIYFAGGYPEKPGGGQTFATAHAWRYDTIARQYVALPDLPQPRGSGALVAIDGELHFISGVSPDRVDRTDHWVLDPRDANPHWVARAPIPFGRSHLGYIAYQGRIWALGGHQKFDEGAVYQSRVDIYDPATDRWSAGTPLPAPRGHIGGAVELVAGRITVMGGDDAFLEPNNNVWSWDPVDGRWETLTPLPKARYAGFAGVVGGRLYYIAGDFPKYATTYCALFLT